LMFYVLAVDGNLNLWDGILLSSCIIGYVVFLIKESRRERDPLVLAEYDELSEDDLKPQPLWNNLFWLAIGIAGMVGGSTLPVEGAGSVATAFGVRESMIGREVLALGTSLPEMAMAG